MQYSDGRTYFFKNGKYFKFDDARISVEEAQPSYPRDTGRVGGILTRTCTTYFFGLNQLNDELYIRNPLSKSVVMSPSQKVKMPT